MKPWLSSSLVIGPILRRCGAACGGGGGSGGGLSLEQYFDQVEAIVKGLQARTAVLDQPLEQEFPSEGEHIEAFRDAFTTVIPIFRDFVDELSDIEAPPEVVDAHGELVAGLADLAEGVEDLVGQLAEVESLSEVQELVISGFDADFGQLAAVCLQLQSIADDNDIDVDIRCAA